ncbi:MAG: SDR family oxidoreductase [Candidatus Sericytochromatia bacterium]|nr:SDR family oxidoreductase [Candidatus Sericytochromatia bacterium]
MDSRPVHVVLGAGGGIGSALSRRLVAAGAIVAVVGRTAATIEGLAEEIGAQPYVLDATDSAAVRACIDSVKVRFGRLDGIANCVGSLLLKPLHLTSDDEWQATIQTNLGSAMAAVRAGVLAMRETGGAIVLVSSAAARVGMANHEAIAAAKAGIIGLTLSAAATYASRGIRINAVAPGLIRTPLTARLTGNPASEKVSLAMHALPRLGEPDDVASAIAWFLDPANCWVTGQVLGVDGGLATIRPTVRAL